MKFTLFIVISLALHVGFFFGSQFKWETKKTYAHSDVLLMGDPAGKKINPPPKKKKKKEVKKKKKIVNNDPNAVKTNEKVEEEDMEEGAFGQGGKKPLPYEVALQAWLKANRKYPRMARRLGHEGIVKVQFKIHPDGKLTDVSVTEGCDYETLNDAAVKLVYASSPFRPFPSHFKQTPKTKIVPIAYSLRR